MINTFRDISDNSAIEQPMVENLGSFFTFFVAY